MTLGYVKCLKPREVKIFIPCLQAARVRCSLHHKHTSTRTHQSGLCNTTCVEADDSMAVVAVCVARNDTLE